MAKAASIQRARDFDWSVGGGGAVVRLVVVSDSAVVVAFMVSL